MNTADRGAHTKLGILQALVALARQQQAALESGDVDVALDIMGRRKTVLEQWPTAQALLSDEACEEAQALGAVLRALDESIERKLEAALESAGSDLAEARRGRQAHRAYRSQHDAGARLLDGKT